MTTDIERALSYDAIHEAEKLTGLDYKNNDGVTALGMLLMQRQRNETDALLFLNNDTNSWSQTREQWEQAVLGMGFELVYVARIPDTQDFHRIYWRNGVLLTTDSYWGDKSVNAATAYFNFKGPRNAMFQCSNGHAGTIDGVDVWTGSRDAREGLRFALDKMSEAGELLEKWIERPFLWLLHYQDVKTEGYDHKYITAQRIAQLPQHIQDSISQ